MESGRRQRDPAALSAKGPTDASGLLARTFGFDTRARALYRINVGALHQFLDILFKPDNIPIAGMLILVFFFTWVALRQALRNDRLIEQGRADEILKEMQE